jgi:hypothetical protein
MTNPQVPDGQDGLHIEKTAANILHMQWSSSRYESKPAGSFLLMEALFSPETLVKSIPQHWVAYRYIL